MSNALRSQKWDFISLQQVSGSSGLADTYGQLDYLISYVKMLCPDAKVVWNMTWAYQQDSTHGDFVKYNKDQMTMYNAILNAVAQRVSSRKDIFAVIPTGTAVQNARTSYIGDNLTRDGFHLSLDFGRYVAGMTFVHKLTGLSVKNVKYMPAGVDDTMRKIAIESATNAVKKPRAVTNSEHTREPAFDQTQYTKLDLSWTALGYWNSVDVNKHHAIITDAENSKQFYASRMLSKTDLPIGSVIEVASGWQYRPEGWKDSGRQSSRPNFTQASRVAVTQDWWGDYTHRAFNLSKIGSGSLEDAENEIDAAFTVWIPKK